ncbi:MAG: GNAT family N-acetyltransferase [Aulosira sp. DedQUE10]|nr:GNAT family N-acetyltransferase [Aulosira sp. DedQUE10]
MKSLIEITYGWDEKEQKNYAQESLTDNIVLLDGAPAGVLTISYWQNELHLTWIALLPSYQHHGLGTKLLLHAQQETHKLSKPLTLQVLKCSPAFSFYQRHGFSIYDTNGLHKVLMRWQPNKTL